MSYRHLNSSEIAALEANGCSSTDWQRVMVTDPFSPERYRRSHFSGDVKLGAATGTILRDGKIPMPAGVYNAVVHNCTIGDNVFINRIGNYIADYNIGDNVVIENTGTINCSGSTTFGNGVEVSVMNETGGREVTIHAALTAHEAYLEAMYRHRPELVAALKRFAQAKTDAARSWTARRASPTARS